VTLTPVARLGPPEALDSVMPTFRDAAARSRRSQGAFLDIPPTGRTVEYASIEIYRTADGKLAEE
jgi:hypothetical protein